MELKLTEYRFPVTDFPDGTVTRQGLPGSGKTLFPKEAVESSEAFKNVPFGLFRLLKNVMSAVNKSLPLFNINKLALYSCPSFALMYIPDFKDGLLDAYTLNNP